MINNVNHRENEPARLAMSLFSPKIDISRIFFVKNHEIIIGIQKSVCKNIPI